MDRPSRVTSVKLIWISYDGGKLDPPYKLPSPPPHNFVAEEGEKIYTGSCHCGGVRVAAKAIKPIPQVFVNEDNCSICIKVCFLSFRSLQFHHHSLKGLALYPHIKPEITGSLELLRMLIPE